MLRVDVADDGTLYQVQELVDGETLHQALRRHGRFSPEAAARVLGTLADALAAAHAVRLVHRDVKPANVMLTPGPPGLKLLDFGVATFREQAAAPHGDAMGPDDDLPTIHEPMTRAGAVIGTPGFLGPESLTGGEVTDRTDVYALGVVAVLLLTGEHPPAGRPPTALGDRTPDALRQAIVGCLDVDPANRPSARELAQVLHALADACGAPALPALVTRDALRGHTIDDQPTLHGADDS